MRQRTGRYANCVGQYREAILQTRHEHCCWQQLQVQLKLLLREAAARWTSPASKFTIILACEAGGGLDRVVIREGSRATATPLLGPHARMWLVIRHICEQSYATWTSGSAICHCHISEVAVYINICPSPSHHSEKLHDSREHVGTTTFLNT